MKERLGYIREYLEAYLLELQSNGFYSPELIKVIEACDLSIPFEL